MPYNDEARGLRMRDDEYRRIFECEERFWWYEGMRAVTASFLDGRLKSDPAPRLLDVGCGTGYSIVWLRKHLLSSQAFGIDSSPQAAEFWHQRRINTAGLASADKLPFGDGEFDLVTCFDVIYQLDDKSAREAVCEMNRVLKPGGILFIREPAYEWMRGSHDLAIGTRHRYTHTELRRMLRDCGFNLVRSTYANTLLFWVAAFHRILSRLRGGSESDVQPVPDWINRSLLKVLRLEAILLRRIAFPFGLSVIGVAQKT
jgi:SAM-dependent methyltransferase